MSRVKDPALLDRLHTVWNDHGCAICGQGPVELHHVKKRSQGGGDTIGNILGVCGAYSKNQHHLAIENHTVELVPSSGGLGWKDSRTGEWGYCRYPKDFEPGAGVLPTPVSEPSIAPPAAHTVGVPEVSPPGVTVAPLTVRGPDPAGKQSLKTPAGRFEWLQQASQDASRTYMTMAMLLQGVKESGEWQTLGFDAFRDYWGENGLGLPSGTVSKMLRVAVFYRDQWRDALNTGASVEKLYLAAQCAEESSEAIGLAASMPTFELRALAKGEPPPEDQPRCDECGQRLPPSYEARKHDRASLERGESRKGSFVSDI